MTAAGVAETVLRGAPPVALVLGALLAAIGAGSLVSAVVDVLKAMTGWK